MGGSVSSASVGPVGRSVGPVGTVVGRRIKAAATLAGHNSHGSCCPSPHSQGTLSQHPWNFIYLFLFFIFIFIYFLNLENHMEGQMKGGEMKGSEARVIFITMDASWGMKKSPHVCCGMVPWLFIGGGTVIAMAMMGVSTSMSDHQNYVRPLVVSPP
jgi:hypothetical protein